MHMDPLVLTLTGTVFVVLILGAILSIFKIPHVVAYLVAGVILGPHGLSLVEDISEVAKLEDIGIILLLFFVGMKVTVKNLLAVWKVAIIGTGIQIFVSVLAVGVIGNYFQWTLDRVVLLGFIISLSSTAVVLKILDEWKEEKTEVGKDAIGILLVQDIAIVPMIIIVDVMQGAHLATGDLTIQLLGGLGVLGILTWLGVKKKVHLPGRAFLMKNQELQVFAVLALCFGMALIMDMLYLSSALGAFLAGIIVSTARETHWVHQKLEPFYVFFVAIFFVSMGMIINLSFIWENFGPLLIIVLGATVIKTAINAGVIWSFGLGKRQSLYGGALLSQIGEFSFILVHLGANMKLIGTYEYNMAISMISLSLLICPVWIQAVKLFNRNLLIYKGDSVEEERHHRFKINSVSSVKGKRSAISALKR